MNKSRDIKISFYNVTKTISDSIDLMSNEITGHHKLVAYISLRLGLKLNLSKIELRKLVFSALIHDIGILYFDKKIDDILENRTDKEHAYAGYTLLKDYFPFPDYAEIIKNHHSEWETLENNRTNYLSNILNLADLTAFLIDRKEINILYKSKGIVKELNKYSQSRINPEILSVMNEIVYQESFWLDTISVSNRESIFEEYILNNLDTGLTLDEVLKISEIVSRIIDFRSSYTATHSKGAATVAVELAKAVGFSREDTKIIEIAGHFHDIGKMILPISLINKKGRLNKEEWGLMKSHPYYSYYVLDNIIELPKLKEWSAYHHEKLDGTGYPFRLDQSKLSIGARIMAVSDIFTALAEDRPYRPGLEKNDIIKILKEEAYDKKIDKRMVSLLTDDFERYNETRNKKQQKAILNYNEFKEKISDELFNIYQSSTA